MPTILHARDVACSFLLAVPCGVLAGAAFAASPLAAGVSIASQWEPADAGALLYAAGLPTGEVAEPSSAIFTISGDAAPTGSSSPAGELREKVPAPSPATPAGGNPVPGQPVPPNSDASTAASPSASPTIERWAVHAQSTFTEIYQPAFRSPYQGAQSLNPGSLGRETWDVTLYGGMRPWRGAEIWIDPEVDQGFGPSNTFGVAGYPSAEAYKLGAADPYVRLQRLFLRQTLDLGGGIQGIDPDLNQLGGAQTADHIVLTIGKFSSFDVFDTNKYAHDPRNDFLNW